MEQKLLKHEHVIIRAFVNNPPMCPTKMDLWMKNMIKSIDMDILDGPRSIYSDMIGNRGLTSSAILNTSHAVVHTWDEVQPALIQVDVYSCGKLDENIVIDLLDQFDYTNGKYFFLDREDDLTITRTGEFTK